MEHIQSVINIAIVGGDLNCCEILEKTTRNLEEKGVNAHFTAVADPNPRNPGMVLAARLGLVTVQDYHQLYDPQYNIHLIIISTSDQNLFNKVLKTRPPHIRLMSFHVFNIFWKAIRSQERKLKARNEEILTILNGIQDFILVIRPDMVVEEANGWFLKKMGYCSEEIIGRKCYEIYHKTFSQCTSDTSSCPLINVIRSKNNSPMIQTRTDAKGEMRYYEVDVYPIWETNGKISKFIHISRDITDHKREELEITHKLEQMVAKRTRQLKETHEILLHQDKMASMGKLSASVVHEINNPIAGILNFILLIKRMCNEGSVTDREMSLFTHYLSLMETETRRIGRIVSNLLAFSRQSQTKKEGIDINRLIEITLAMNLNLLKLSRIRIEKQTTPLIPVMTGSEDQLQQVFMNLISNAIEAMESCERRVLSIETVYSKREHKIIISISDTGVGIPSDHLTKLFEPFFTTKKKGKGVGLGLSVAYGIIKEHGGCILVESEANLGTTFMIEFPV